MYSEKLLFRRGEAARALGVSTATLDRMIGERQLAASRMGGAVVITKAELERFVAENLNRWGPVPKPSEMAESPVKKARNGT